MCADQKKLHYSITVSPRYVSQCIFYMLIFILAFIKDAMCLSRSQILPKYSGFDALFLTEMKLSFKLSVS